VKRGEDDVGQIFTDERKGVLKKGPKRGRRGRAAKWRGADRNLHLLQFRRKGKIKKKGGRKRELENQILPKRTKNWQAEPKNL